MVSSRFKPVIHSLLEFRQTERLWHIPLLASLAAGIPLVVGWYFDRMGDGILASTAGLVILYLPSTDLSHRMITMLACSFGLLLSFTGGIVFSFHPIISAFALMGLVFAVQWVANFFRLPPPGSFFFLMIASIASTMPFDLANIPAKVGVVALGTMLACGLAFVYSLYITRRLPAKDRWPKAPAQNTTAHPKTDPGARGRRYDNAFESGITAIFMGSSLLVAHLLDLHNPYWVPISCLAVMQGVSLQHIWSRSLQRILGTFVGLALTWLLLLQHPSGLAIIISIFLLQFIIEMLVVRNYGLAVVFITPLTLFLAEAGSALTADPNMLIPARFLDITLGSIIGAIAGWFIHHDQLRRKAGQGLRKTRIAFYRR